jgi:hypothetical protein
MLSTLGIHQLLPLYNYFSIHRSASPTVKLISEHSLPTSEAYVPVTHNCLLRELTAQAVCKACSVSASLFPILHINLKLAVYSNGHIMPDSLDTP